MKQPLTLLLLCALLYVYSAPMPNDAAKPASAELVEKAAAAKAKKDADAVRQLITGDKDKKPPAPRPNKKKGGKGGKGAAFGAAGKNPFGAAADFLKDKIKPDSKVAKMSPEERKAYWAQKSKAAASFGKPERPPPTKEQMEQKAKLAAMTPEERTEFHKAERERINKMTPEERKAHFQAKGGWGNPNRLSGGKGGKKTDKPWGNFDEPEIELTEAEKTEMQEQRDLVAKMTPEERKEHYKVERERIQALSAEDRSLHYKKQHAFKMSNLSPQERADMKARMQNGKKGKAPTPGKKDWRNLGDKKGWNKPADMFKGIQGQTADKMKQAMEKIKNPFGGAGKKAGKKAPWGGKGGKGKKQAGKNPFGGADKANPKWAEIAKKAAEAKAKASAINVEGKATM